MTERTAASDRASWASRLRTVARRVLAVALVGAGVNHFVNPGFYLPLIPPPLPRPAFWNGLAGVAEIAGGVGLLVPAVRRPAAWGLTAMLVGFLWVHVEMLANPARTAAGRAAPAWLLWARLPLQGVLIAWTLWAGRPDGRSGTPDDGGG